MTKIFERMTWQITKGLETGISNLNMVSKHQIIVEGFWAKLHNQNFAVEKLTWWACVGLTKGRRNNLENIYNSNRKCDMRLKKTSSSKVLAEP